MNVGQIVVVPFDVAHLMLHYFNIVLFDGLFDVALFDVPLCIELFHVALYINFKIFEISPLDAALS